MRIWERFADYDDCIDFSDSSLCPLLTGSNYTVRSFVECINEYEKNNFSVFYTASGKKRGNCEMLPFYVHFGEVKNRLY